jgi:hypothetical protein
VERSKITGTEGQLSVSTGPEGTKIKFASEIRAIISVNGDEVPVLIPMRATT